MDDQMSTRTRSGPCKIDGEEYAGSRSCGEDEVNVSSEETTPPMMRNETSMKNWFEELQAIGSHLKVMKMEVNEREEELSSYDKGLAKREDRVARREAEIEAIVAEMMTNAERLEKEKSESQCSRREECKEKDREIRRMRANYDRLQESKNQLKERMAVLEDDNSKLVRQNASLRQRLKVSQHRQEMKKTDDIVDCSNTLSKVLKLKAADRAPREKRRSSRPREDNSTAEAAAEVLAVLLDSTVRDVIQPAYGRDKLVDGATLVPVINSCLKLLPPLIRILKQPNVCWHSLHKPSLVFMYWSCLLISKQADKQISSICIGMRKLVDDLYRPIRAGDTERTTSAEIDLSDPHVSLLSYLIMLKTLKPADCVANVLSALKHALRDQLNRELFMQYRGCDVLFSFLDPPSRVHLAVVFDIYLMLCVDTSLTRPVLGTCSQPGWFRSVATILRASPIDEKLLENISIILQKLSRVKENRKYFETSGLQSVLRDILKSISTTSANSFLLLNLRSVQFSLTDH